MSPGLLEGPLGRRDAHSSKGALGVRQGDREVVAPRGTNLGLHRAAEGHPEEADTGPRSEGRLDAMAALLLASW